MYVERMQRAIMRPPITAEELYSLPDDDMRHELLLGCLLTEPPAGYRHGRIWGRIYVLLDEFARSRGLGEVVASDVGFILARSPDTVRAPDVAFVSKERLLTFRDRSMYFPGPPDLAVEVLSPSERSGTIHGKVADYLAAGTKLVWLIDPEAQSVSVYRSLLVPRILSGDQELTGEEILPGLSIKVSDLFSE